MILTDALCNDILNYKFRVYDLSRCPLAQDQDVDRLAKILKGFLQIIKTY
jgi:hypothetical protein